MLLMPASAHAGVSCSIDVVSDYRIRSNPLSGGRLLGCYCAALIDERLQLIALQRYLVWTTMQVPDTGSSTPVRYSKTMRGFSGLLTHPKQ